MFDLLISNVCFQISTWQENQNHTDQNLATSGHFRHFTGKWDFTLTYPNTIFYQKNYGYLKYIYQWHCAMFPKIMMKSKYSLMLPLLVIWSIFFFLIYVISAFSLYDSVLGYGLIFLWLLFAMISEITNIFRATKLVSHGFFCQGWEPGSDKSGLLPQLFRRVLIMSFSYPQETLVTELLQTWGNIQIFFKINYV